MGTIKWKIMGDDQEYFTDEEMYDNAKDDYSKCPTLVNFVLVLVLILFD
jgi:hypothetical protein